MSYTRGKGSPEIAIHIDDSKSTYKPGDTITGYVDRKVPILVGAESTRVTISLVGISRTKHTLWSDHTGESQSEYTSCFHLLSARQTLQTLHHGPVHIPQVAPEDVERSKGQSWPFRMVIPTHPSAAALQLYPEKNKGNMPTDKPEEHRSDGSYLPLDEYHVGTHTLPPTFYRGGQESGPGEFLDACIEYYLKAYLEPDSSNHRPVTVLPLVIQGFPPPSLAASFESRKQLLQLCKSDITLEIAVPTMYQLSHTGFLSFKIRAFKDHRFNARRWCRKQKVPEITLKNFNVALKSTTAIRYTRDMSAFSVHFPTVWVREASSSQTHTLYTVTRSSHLDEQPPLIVPCAEDGQCLDLSHALYIRRKMEINTPQASAPREDGMVTAWPTFTTYNVKFTHKLVWGATLSVNGREILVDEEQDIEIL
jgi:hypothetical protein